MPAPPVRRLLGSKIHRATVTHADLEYEGSLTIAGDLMDAADILEHEEVRVWNVSRGTRFSTYALRGPAGDGVICVNGAAAHLAGPGDQIIVATFIDLPDPEARRHHPRIVLVDDANRIARVVAKEIAGPGRRG